MDKLIFLVQYGKVFILMLELDIGLRTALLPTIIQVILVDNLILIVTVMTEVYIGLIPSKFIHVTTVN